MNLQRLHILYDHLMWGKLGHKVFNFNTYNNITEPECGTAGCAIGECPIIWNEWVFGYMGSPLLNNTSGSMVSASGKEWFEIDSDEFKHLFLPEKQNTEIFGGRILTDETTREQVAYNIKAFIDKCYKPEGK